jgi:hypothetical protein
MLELHVILKEDMNISQIQCLKLLQNSSNKTADATANPVMF